MSDTTSPSVADVLAELAALEDPRIRAVNKRHGDDHGEGPRASCSCLGADRHGRRLGGCVQRPGHVRARLR